MASTIEPIEIFPGENGGHRAVHNFKRQPGKKEGSMAGGVYMERPKPGEQFFGKSEDSKVLPHVGKALNLPPLNAQLQTGRGVLMERMLVDCRTEYTAQAACPETGDVVLFGWMVFERAASKGPRTSHILVRPNSPADVDPYT